MTPHRSNSFFFFLLEYQTEAGAAYYRGIDEAKTVEPISGKEIEIQDCIWLADSKWSDFEQFYF